jgi:hypothetical protein
MSDEHRVSRRASLKGLGVLGVAVALGASSAAQSPAEPRRAAGDQDKPGANPVDLAVDRFSKGHS